ncbi:MAG: response regulator [Deltaproteobacteria bacterium]|nr:response regulator [Deltaproteobacteria bacterium]
MEADARPRILCVDDEPNVLEGLSLNLRRRYRVSTASSGPAALEMLEQDASIAVIISDMRMPVMDGAAFLARVRVKVPGATRILLTGQADMTSAAAAVNDGQVFRFLLKPCPPQTLLAVVDAAVDQHRLLVTERLLLEETLHGAIKALVDVLALVSPASSGRAIRLRKLVTDLATHLGMTERWQVEVAAMVSQIGSLTLSPALAEKIYYGQPLSADERQLADRVPQVGEQLLSNIPRLEPVREILSACARPQPPPAARDDLVACGARLLRLAIDFDVLESSEGTSASLAIEALRGRKDAHPPALLEALAAVRGDGSALREVREVRVLDLRAGMIVAEDVKTPSGGLLVARGYEVTDRFLERVWNFPEPVRRGLWRVIVPEARAVPRASR